MKKIFYTLIKEMIAFDLMTPLHRWGITHHLGWIVCLTINGENNCYDDDFLDTNEWREANCSTLSEQGYYFTQN